MTVCRGHLAMEVTITGAEKDLHSGVDGGIVFQPLADLIGVMDSLVDSRGMVMIPGFYDSVVDVTVDEVDTFLSLMCKFHLRTFISAIPLVHKLSVSVYHIFLLVSWHCCR